MMVVPFVILLFVVFVLAVFTLILAMGVIGHETRTPTH